MPTEIPDNLKSLAAELDAFAGRAAAPSDADATAENLPRLDGTDYVLLRKIGAGGMGAVYLARQVSLDREVAVKILSRELATDPAFRARFAAESRLVARLHHPNIVQILSAGTTDSDCYFAMELVRGATAETTSSPSLESVLALGVVLADALDYAHRSCGVIHRDVKPSNVFVADDGSVKLGDFGLACFAGDVADRASGTRKYMAPEQVADGAVTPACDQYALGLTLMELAADFPAMRRDADLAAIFARATATAPADRYASMADFAADLRHYLAHEPVAARPPALAHRARLWVRRNPLAALGACLASVSFAAFLVTLVVAYLHAERALNLAEREAATAAQTLTSVLTDIDRLTGDKRGDELLRAQRAVEALAERFPENGEIKRAAWQIEQTRGAHARVKARADRGSGLGRGRSRQTNSPTRQFVPSGSMR